MAKVTAEILQMRQKYPLDLKVDMSLNRINHWYKQYAGNVYVAFSGGKDSTVYNMGVSHTGCIFCCFGVHLESRPNRFDCMKITHPKLYNYCMKKLNIKQVLETLGIGEYNGLIDIKKIIKGRSHER